jgi:hypothetical protein
MEIEVGRYYWNTVGGQPFLIYVIRHIPNSYGGVELIKWKETAIGIRASRDTGHMYPIIASYREAKLKEYIKYKSHGI